MGAEFKIGLELRRAGIVLLCLLGAAFLGLGAVNAAAQPGILDENGCHIDSQNEKLHCHAITPRAVKSAALPQAGDTVCPVDQSKWCKGCGCKGGPGYRDKASGNCLSYFDVIKTCGNPPQQRCDYEDHENAGKNRDCILARAKTKAR